MAEEFRVEDIPGTAEYERKQLRLLLEQDASATPEVDEPEPVIRRKKPAEPEEAAPEVTSTVEEPAAPAADSKES